MYILSNITTNRSKYQKIIINIECSYWLTYSNFDPLIKFNLLHLLRETDKMKGLIIFGLLSISLAVSVTNQGTLTGSTSRVERLVTKFMQLSDMSTQFNFNKLFDAID